MGPGETIDDLAVELADVQNVRSVVDRLRQLFAAAFEANPVREASRFDGPAHQTAYQSAPGR
jgi:hypothetical protein